MGDPLGIRVLFQNLLTNALKFRHQGTAPYIQIFAEKEEKNWKIVVKDDGIGIQPEHQEKIFAIFHRLHSREEFEGTGIGLAQCKKIVDSHQGKIGVDSQPENGSSFWFTLQKTHG
ncbi:MAG: ATP-binding protein [Bacteroidota bacterium]